MYAEFSHDLMPGTHPSDEVLQKILEKFDLKPNGMARRDGGVICCRIRSSVRSRTRNDSRLRTSSPPAEVRSR